MPTRNPTPEKDLTRKRKAHTKSRGGCVNCKIRHIKCDEIKPCCRRCYIFGVACSYDRASAHLQPLPAIAFTNTIPSPNTTLSANTQVLGLLNDSVSRQSAKEMAFRFSLHDLEIVNRFHARTILTVGNEKAAGIYQRESVRLAFQHPFLCHLVITLTLMHDRFNISEKQTTAELFHWLEGTSQFNSIISGASRGNLTSSQKDAVWIASIVLGCTTLAQVDSNNPEEIWPMQSTPSDLDWLKISTGKSEIWRLVNLGRSDSALRELCTDFAGGQPLPTATDSESLKVLPPELIELLELGSPTASPATNPYYGSAVVLARLLPLATTADNLIHFLQFIIQMTPRFMLLLEDKDPRALLLLVYYHAKISQDGRWWWRKRAMLEGQSICIFLERYHGNTSHLEMLLEFPKAHFWKGGNGYYGWDPPRSSLPWSSSLAALGEGAMVAGEQATVVQVSS
ncbi:hypothetical protein B0H63DRAFT_105439 [Podospora didyma]|uniref:Zn(2)-C6 fungal-type domain-containing protein n=1 Tax=Podospora didyma TaxID=330526 RepID=A0AAE0U444_9PEZI|nr:hypothetical protein B0H63DRAFT_105439 [Podospora didyma]